MALRPFSIAGMLLLASGWVTLSVTGCATGGAERSAPATASTSTNHQQTAAPFGDPKYRELVDKLEKNQGNVDAAIAPSTMDVISGKFRAAGKSVGDALTLKPKVIPASDPVSLSSKPVSIGVEVYYEAGRLAEQNGNQAGALRQYQRALEKAPDHVPTLISLARLHDRQGQFKQAETLYRQAIQAQPANAMAHNDLGLCFARQERFNEALTTLRQAVNLEPNRKLYRNNLATVLVTVNRMDEAWQELSRGYAPSVAHYNLGFLLHRAGRSDEARRQLNLALQADPTLQSARTMLAELGAPPATPPAAAAARLAAPYPLDAAAGRGASSAAGQPPLQYPIRKLSAFVPSEVDRYESLPTPSDVLNQSHEPGLLPIVR